jgi:hypothetical protein
VANVNDHARTQCRVTVSVQDTGLRVDVRDFFPGPPPRPRPIDVHAQRGRGLQVVDALSAVGGVTEFDDESRFGRSWLRPLRRGEPV